MNSSQIQNGTKCLSLGEACEAIAESPGGANVEYTANGVAYENKEPITKRRNVINKGRKRNILIGSPKIFVDDGSNGSNLINTYSYKVYAEEKEKPSIENHYSNNFNNSLTSNPVYEGIDGLRLHPTGESGGYSNFTIPQYKR